jgi:archaellum component FlaC
MDVKTYCDNVDTELNSWKARLYDVVRKSARLAADEKKSLEPTIQELHTIVDNLSERIEFLTRECPAEWSQDKAAIDENMNKMKTKWKEVWGAMGEEEYGLGGA